MNKVMLVCYKNYIWRQGIKSFISKLQTYSLVADVNFDDDCKQHVNNAKPDIVIVDASLIDVFGMNILEEFCSNHLSLSILIIGDLDQLERIELIFRHGVKGFISNACTEEQLLDAINSVIRNKEWIAPELASKFFGKMKQSYHQSIHFTQRELEILSLMVNGFNNTEIAKHLHVSIYTIQNHISNIYAKIGMNERLKVVHFAIQNRIINI